MYGKRHWNCSDVLIDVNNGVRTSSSGVSVCVTITIDWILFANNTEYPKFITFGNIPNINVSHRHLIGTKHCVLFTKNNRSKNVYKTLYGGGPYSAHNFLIAQI